MTALPERVSVRMPGSTSNCGAGFDTLGLALQVYNRIELRRAGDVIRGATEADQRGQKMVESTARLFFQAVARAPFGFEYSIRGDVPPARGLGSSVTVIGGILGGLNALSGAGLSRDQLVGLASELEGHPDNASAGILGGFCVARSDPTTNRYLGVIRIPISDELVFVVCSPSVEVVTKESRGALPDQLPYFDAVKSINSATYLVAALATRDYNSLRHAVSDFMHEPYRLPRIPGGRAAIDAGIACGALTGWLSGSGSSVLCIARSGDERRIGEAMKAAFAAVGVPSEVRALRPDNVGMLVE
ncbi:homoserine kinase [Nibricoccus sp. IMCC34717]|uniref:homoserine kinase n=1 Tax=Nibricoccus sp. IMCC34717 TaxID=3034021 RepID=UPI00385061EB